ncbi:25S rRNA (adenine645-N1)-methyltransferase [Xylographa opegraphella]|nr:25S rRNA (adenine645-N1)-methyltransferase [Xylographa opegraphella]
MFAVPGWSVSADSLVSQKETSVSEAGKASKPAKQFANDADHSPAKPSKKRKRGPGGTAIGTTVTSENLADLWEKHIEGRKPAKSNGVGTTAENSKRKKLRRAKELGGGKGELENKSSEVPTDDAGVQDGSGKRGTPEDIPRVQDAVLQAAEKVTDISPAVVKSRKRKSKPADTITSTKTVNPSASRAATFPVPAPKPPILCVPSTSLTALQQAMREKLVSSRFRYLNQTLYSTPSNSSYELFQENPTFFIEYHEGFRRQVSAWPENPVDGFIRWLADRSKVGGKGAILGSQKAQFRKKKKESKGSCESQPQAIMDPVDTKDLEPLPRNPRSGLCTVADLGCGDAQLARTLSGVGHDASPGPAFVKSLNMRVHSFDLAAASPLITVADIGNLPLGDSSVDIAIFCLALMGTNWTDFIEEAWRVLRWKGECWISEVGSRFVSPKAMRVEHSVGNRMKSNTKNKREKADADPSEPGIEDRAMAEEDRVPSAALAQASTDISLFVEVLKTRGFVLAAEPELGNKMFVRMRFLKALTPTKGKGVPVQNDAGGQTWGTKKFVDRSRGGESTGGVEHEGRVLKPCVYKTR